MDEATDQDRPTRDANQVVAELRACRVEALSLKAQHESMNTDQHALDGRWEAIDQRRRALWAELEDLTQVFAR